MTRPSDAPGGCFLAPSFDPTSLPTLGDRVALSARYLAAICPAVAIGEGNRASILIGPEPHMRGQLVAAESEAHPLVSVLWDDTFEPRTINVNNLVRECDIDRDAERTDTWEAWRRREVAA